MIAGKTAWRRSPVKHRIHLAALLALASCIAPLHAQWQPERTVEIVAMSGPGGANDVIARALQQHLQTQKMIPVPVTVSNRPGAGGVLAWQYLNQQPATALSVSPINLLTEHILGASPLNHTHVTPIAQLFNEYVVFTVKPDSPLRTLNDLATRLRADPAAVTFSVAAALGGANHLATALAGKAAGANVRRMKFVVFTSGAQSLTAAMGGHVDVAVTPLFSAAPQVQAGRLRALGVSSAQRQPGAMSHVPTWREAGLDVVFSSWRGVIGPKSMTPAQVGYWENVLARLTRTPEWARELERNYWEAGYLGSAETRRQLDAQYAEYRTLLGELGLAR